MYTIYFDKRNLTICKQNPNYIYNPNSIVYYNSTHKDLQNIINYILNNNHIKSVYLPTPNDTEELYNQVCNEFTQINAGGGLITNSKGEYLLIYRNGVWDLPKGKQEEGEEIKTTAVREVCEECGLKDVESNDNSPFCITHHTYINNNCKILKHTHWFKMVCNDNTLKPQLEENIERCEWVSKENISNYINESYPSIKEVFKSANLL